MNAQVFATTRSALSGLGATSVSLGLQQPRELVRVHVVLGTAERLDPVPHRESLSRSNTERTALGVELAEREGFEPSGPLSQAAFLAGMWFKPNSPTSPSPLILLNLRCFDLAIFHQPIIHGKCSCEMESIK